MVNASWMTPAPRTRKPTNENTQQWGLPPPWNPRLRWRDPHHRPRWTHTIPVEQEHQRQRDDATGYNDKHKSEWDNATSHNDERKWDNAGTINTNGEHEWDNTSTQNNEDEHQR
jgi:hypothetical protein